VSDATVKPTYKSYFLVYGALVCLTALTVARALADFFVEVVHQHAQRGFLVPALAA